MDHRFTALAAQAANHHGVFTTAMAGQLGISESLCHQWSVTGRVERLGTHSFRFAGSPVTWKMLLMSALGDLGHGAAVGGRSAAALHRLDGFHEGPVEVWLPRPDRNRSSRATIRTCSRPLRPGDLVTVDGIRCLSPERLILDSLLFRFSAGEIHNAIDSAVRMRVVSQRRLRERILDELPTNSPHRRRLVGALIDLGGESMLERRFLALVRRAGLPRPHVQRVYRAGSRTIARVDAEFDGGVVVELAGHGTHSTRRQRQRDAQRHTELTLLHKRVITFTYDDVYGRPDWMLATLGAVRASIAA
ncbi:MAG TPA: hypothetical protein VLD86_08780 [Ilumatobacteraceae bacterium]|nr:hypothetical protein [Ilumatobacteraceae bacterium]